MEKKEEFDLWLALLRQVVAARGRDPANVDAEYVWPAGGARQPAAAAVSLSPLLTGGGQVQAPGAPAGGVVPVPRGITPPKS